MDPAHPGRERRVGAQDGRAGGDGEFGGARGSEGGGLGPDGPFGGGHQPVERRFRERPDGEGEFGVVGGDVAALARPHRAHREHGLLGGHGLLGHHGAQPQHGGGGHQDRVEVEVRGGRVSSPAVQDRLDGDAARHQGLPAGRGVGEGPGGERGGVLGQDRVGDAEPLVQPAVLQQGPGPAQRLLLGLADDEDRAPPAVPGRGEEGHRAGDRRDVQVVAAGVHDAGHGAGVRESGGLGDGQRVEFGAQEHRGAGAVAQDPDESVAAAHGTGDRAAVFREPGGEAVGGAVFVGGEFGVGVQVEVELDGGAEQLARQGAGRR